MLTHVKPPFFILLAVAICALVFLGGCASNEPQEYITEHELAIIEAHAAQPTLELECPEGGCNFTSFRYKDPRDKIQLPERPTNIHDLGIAFLHSGERIANNALPYGVTGWVAKEGLDAARDLGTALKGSGETTRVTNIDRSTDIGDNSGAQSGNEGTLGDYSGEQSGNEGTLNSDIPGRVQSPGPIDRSDNSDNSDNSTGAPAP